MIATARSLADPAALAGVVEQAYGLTVSRVVLLRSLVNDVYRVETTAGPYALKLYRAGHKSVADAAWEVELSRAAGGTVARGVPLRSGAAAGSVPAAEGERAYTLWEWLPGAPPQPPYDDALFRRYGVATARFHAAALGAPPRRLDVLEALGRPYDEAIARVSGGDRDRFAELAAAARSELSTMDLTAGVCHGDVSLDNLHDTGSGLVFYDLDRAGAGPLAADLTGVSATDHFPAFLDGYRSVREMGPADLAALPWLRVADLIGNLHFHLVDKPAWRGTESLGEGWYASTVDALRAAAGVLLR